MNRHYERAIVLRDLGKFDLAEAEFRKAIAEEPGDGLIRSRMARMISARGKTDEGLAQAQEACRLAPDSADSYWALSSVLLDRGEMTAAEEAAREAVRLAPGESVYLSLLGIVQLNLKENQRALQTANEVLAIDPSQLDGLRTRAMALHRLGRFDEAEAVARNGLQFHPTSDDLMRIRGRALLKRGQAQEALDHFLEARRLAPTILRDTDLMVDALVANSLYCRKALAIKKSWYSRPRWLRYLITGIIPAGFLTLILLARSLEEFIFLEFLGILTIALLTLGVFAITEAEVIAKPMVRRYYPKLLGLDSQEIRLANREVDSVLARVGWRAFVVFYSLMIVFFLTAMTLRLAVVGEPIVPGAIQGVEPKQTFRN